MKQQFYINHASHLKRFVNALSWTYTNENFALWFHSSDNSFYQFCHCNTVVTTTIETIHFVISANFVKQRLGLIKILRWTSRWTSRYV